MITYDDFAKLDIRVGRVIDAERVENTDKLLKLRVNLGNETRTLIAGIAMEYSPDDIVGKEIVVLANLEPKRIRGIESQGMLLAAVDDKPIVLTPDKEVKEGTKVS